MMNGASVQSSPVWFLCEILGRPVVEHGNHILGRVLDLAADVREHDPP
ncbi:MAG: hypothetical protein ISS65_00625 [Desulfobacterales bacterium]|uniref:Uncharacterized protein n=1 Tax=Candidatus Desulfatibia profunda TaxID=2841695 RepID=A0A8J6TLC3_9BACT|nr:hypothetical protein [Candidatus Desulfatibia profunda]MBL7178701.1 hypothetical protein [Desulfobacterales bacterium]